MLYSLLQELAIWLTQSKNLNKDLSAETFSAVVLCFTVARQPMFAMRKSYPECFCLAKEAVLRELAKAAAHDSLDIKLSGKAAKTAVVVASFVPNIAGTDPLWSPPDGLPLYRCLTRGVLSILGSLWQDVKFGV